MQLIMALSVLIMQIQTNNSQLILDAHCNPWDILLTARYLFQHLGLQVTMPIAGYVFYVPLMKTVVSFWQKHYQINFLPVYRKEEYQPVNLLMKLLCWFYPKYLDQKSKQAANRRFVTTASQKLLQTNQAVVVAPYGSPIWFGGEIKRGVLAIMQAQQSYKLSASVWSWQKLRFITKLSSPLTLPQTTLLQQQIKKGFNQLLKTN